MERRTLPLLVLPLAALFALTACTPGIGGGSGDGSGSGSDGESSDDSGSESGGDLGAVLTDCVNGDWHADVNDLAAQVGAGLASSGMNIISSTGSGSQDLSIDGEGYLGFANNMTYVISVDIGDGLVMTVTQTHTGTTGADWAWDGGGPAGDTSGQMVFSNFQNNDYEVHNTVAINGQASDQTVPMPEQPAGDVPLAVTCSGGTMTTKPQPGLYTTTWHR